MIQNNPQIWNKKSYNNNNYLWQDDSFVRKDNTIHKSHYLIDEVYAHGLSTHLFDRNNGIYTYHKKKIEIDNSDKSLTQNEHKTNYLNHNFIKGISNKWKLSIKKSKLLQGE